MSDLKVGDRVRTQFTKDQYNDLPGVIVQRSDGVLGYSWRVLLDGDSINRHFGADELRAETTRPEFVRVETYKSIWLSFPGESVSRKLTVDDATELLHQLDEALS